MVFKDGKLIWPKICKNHIFINMPLAFRTPMCGHSTRVRDLKVISIWRWSHCHCCRKYGRGEKKPLCFIWHRDLAGFGQGQVPGHLMNAPTHDWTLWAAFLHEHQHIPLASTRAISTATTTQYISALHSNLRPALITCGNPVRVTVALLYNILYYLYRFMRSY